MYFPHMGRIVAYNNINWAALYQNIRKAWQRWGMVAKVVTKTGLPVRVKGMLYKATIKLVLLYGIKSWVVTGAMLKLLEGFHHRAYTRITGMTVYRTPSGD